MKWKSAAGPIAVVIDALAGRIEIGRASVILGISLGTLSELLHDIEAVQARSRKKVSLGKRQAPKQP